MMNYIVMNKWIWDLHHYHYKKHQQQFYILLIILYLVSDGNTNNNNKKKNNGKLLTHTDKRSNGTCKQIRIRKSKSEIFTSLWWCWWHFSLFVCCSLSPSLIYLLYLFNLPFAPSTSFNKCEFSVMMTHYNRNNSTISNWMRLIFTFYRNNWLLLIDFNNFLYETTKYIKVNRSVWCIADAVEWLKWKWVSYCRKLFKFLFLFYRIDERITVLLFYRKLSLKI